MSSENANTQDKIAEVFGPNENGIHMENTVTFKRKKNPAKPPPDTGMYFIQFGIS